MYIVELVTDSQQHFPIVGVEELLYSYSLVSSKLIQLLKDVYNPLKDVLGHLLC